MRSMTRHVTLICGPPCSGKSTLARKLAQPGDLVLDLDVIAQQMGSPTRWRHEPAIVQAAEQAMVEALRRLARTEHVTAWVIRSLPEPGRRAHLARAIRAEEVHVLRPYQAETLARATRDGRPPGTATTIRQWYRRYRRSEVDCTCPPDHAWTAAGSAPAADAPSTRGWSSTSAPGPSGDGVRTRRRNGPAEQQQ